MNNLSGTGAMFRHKFRLLNWGKHGYPVKEDWITICCESNQQPYLENYPYKEPFITWIAWCAFLERIFNLPIAY